MRKAQRCITLIGFMGTGKTTIGRALAISLNRDFIDTDPLIEKRVGKSISRIFSEDGEAFFREVEAKIVKEVCGIRSSVVALGGGAILNPESSVLVKESSAVVLLRSSAETIITRTSSNKLRPLLNVSDEDLEQRVIVLLAKREAAYSNAMDIEIETDTMSVGEAVSEIIRRLEL
ncbi:MAG: shikimate kinase [Candidatus Thorarchaeota archaeon]|jgi:shikimate kinase